MKMVVETIASMDLLFLVLANNAVLEQFEKWGEGLGGGSFFESKKI